MAAPVVTCFAPPGESRPCGFVVKDGVRSRAYALPAFSAGAAAGFSNQKRAFSFPNFPFFTKRLPMNTCIPHHTPQGNTPHTTSTRGPLPEYGYDFSTRLDGAVSDESAALLRGLSRG